MKRILGVTAGVAALLAGASVPAFAASGPPVDSGKGVAVTITNPAAAVVTLSQATLTLNATVNTDTPHAAPGLTSVTNSGNTNLRAAAGGVEVVVQSNNGAGYVLQAQGPSGGFTDGVDTPMPNADLHLVKTTSLDQNGNPVTAEGTLDTNQAVLTNPGISGTQWVGDPATDPGYVAGDDGAHIALYVNPNVLIGGRTYTGTVEMIYIPNL